MRDPLDIGEPDVKAWEEFRATYAGAYLLCWLLKEEEHAEDGGHFAGLDDRLYRGELYAETLADEDPAHDGWLPLVYESHGETLITWVPPELIDQLFPHGQSKHDFLWQARGLAALALYSSLESYSRALGIPSRRLVAELEGYFDEKNVDVPVQVDHTLRELEQTRHIFAHNRGIVDQEFIERTVDPKVRPDERKPVTEADLDRFASAVWDCAILLREA